MISVTDNFIDCLMKMQQNISPKIRETAKLCLLDYIGAAFSGATYTRHDMNKYLNHAEKNGTVSCIGTNIKTDILTAAFVNGFNSHALELDDGHRFGMIHLAAPIISAVVAAAQKEKAEGQKLLDGIIIGYEAAVRSALCMQPSHKKRGFHASGTCGTIGAAAGASVVLGLNKKMMKTALSSAAASAAGLLAIQDNESQLKPFNTGNAAASGVNAAYIGLTGFTPPHDTIFGSRGIIKMLSDSDEISALTEEKNYFEIQRIYRKPYAACRHCHSAIDAAGRLGQIHNIPVEQIDELIVSTYRLAINGHDHKDISGSAASAKLSIPYNTAAAYLQFGCGMDTYTDDKLSDEMLNELISKVNVIENTEFTELSPGKRIAEVTVAVKDGRRFSQRVDYAKGDPENPMSEQELESKYFDLMKFAAEEARASSIMESIKNADISANAFYEAL